MKNILIKGLFFIFFCATLMACSSENKKTDSRPNILFILVDDQRDDMLGCAGNPIVQTPAVDKLAEQGVRFTNAFVTTSICAASRASIFTGMYESTHNFTFGKPPLNADLAQICYPALLKEAGYSTAFVGKFGINVENKNSVLNEWFDYYALSPINSPYVEVGADGRRKHSAEIKGEQAISYIRDIKGDKPFCLSLSFNAVHAVDANKEPGNAGHFPYPEEVAELYRDINMPLPELNDPEIFDQHPDFLKESLNRVRYYWRWDTPEKYQVNMKAYYRMISGYDRVIQRVLDELKAKGLDKNTVIIYSADNGYYMGNRGFAGKWSHYEESIRIPMIIYDPREESSTINRLNDKMVLNIDIPSTILDYAGVHIPKEYEGNSMVGLAREKDIPWRDHFNIEHRMDHDQIPKYTGIRNGQYVYANYYEQNPAYEFLHDLKKDPLQLDNLAGDSSYEKVLTEMRGLSK